MSAGRARVLHNVDAEASILGGVLLRNDVLLQLETLEVDDFYHFQHKVVFEAVRNVEANARPIDVVTLENEIERHGKLDAIGGVAFLGELALRVPTVDNVLAYTEIVRAHSYARQRALLLGDHARRAADGEEETDELDADLDRRLGELRARFADVVGARTPKQQPRYARCSALVDVIMQRASEPWVSLSLGDVEVARLRLGAVAMLTGAPGAGKSTCALAFALGHLKRGGSVVYVSVELDGDELVARFVGMQRDTSWEGVLRGELRVEFMRDAAAFESFVVLDGEHATLAELERVIEALRAERDAPILVVIDYLQIVEAPEREMRQRVAGIAQALRRLAKRLRVAALGISQPSRAAGKGLASSELLGAETMTAMAESAEIERSAYVTLALGAHQPEREDGTCLIDLSVGKGRFGGGDRVWPLVYTGRSGRLRTDGEARAASEVRAERAADSSRKRIDAAKLAMIAAAQRATEPLTREDLRIAAAVNREVGATAVSELLDAGDLAEVRNKKPRARDWRIWTVHQATAAGIALVRGDVQ
jgi:replicative DNA helicase